MKKIKNILKIILKGLCFLFVSLFICVMFIFYSPYTHKLRNLYISTAMTTMRHQYLAKIFFSNDLIKEVMDNNKVEDYGQKSKIEDIKIANKKNEEKQKVKKKIDTVDLKENNNLDLLEKIEVKGDNYKGYIIKVGDPSRVFVGCTKNLLEHGQKLNKIAENYNAIAGINSGGFVDKGGHGNGGTPFGLVISDSEVIYEDGSREYHIIGFNKDNILILGKYNIEEIKKLNLRDAVTFGPNLIINGKAINILGNGGGGLQPRTAIAQKKDGTVLLLVIDGRQFSSAGITYKGVQKLLLEHGAYNAAILDGGSSSTMYYKGEIINHPCGPIGARYLPNAFLVKKR